MISFEKLSIIELLLNDYKTKDFNSDRFIEFITTLTPEKPPPPPKPEVRAGVFKGGGVKVLAYIGVVEALQEEGLIDKLKYLAGSSGGSIFALLIALGFDGNQIVRIFKNLDLVDFTDKRESMLGDGFAATMISQVVSILSEGKVYSGQNMRAWVEGLLEHVLGDKNATFEDLHLAKKNKPSLKDLYLVATRIRPNMDESYEVVFGVENFPRVRIADAFCASAALPPVYEPVLVREKDGTEVGRFNDGGLLNNFPVEVFDDNAYCERHYKLQFIRYKHQATPYAINPCTMGFSLVSHVDQLDPEITPFTPRLVELTKINGQEGQEAPHIKPEHKWSNWDIIKGGLLYKYGQLAPEDSERKYKTHPENIIQIYVEEVDTTEFNLSEEKATRLIASGKHAFHLWYKKFRAPNDYYKGDYIEKLKLTDEEHQLKAQDPKLFYITKTAKHIQALFDELSRYPTADIEDVATNARVVFLCARIFYDMYKKLNKFEDLNESIKLAFNMASNNHQKHREQLSKDRVHLNGCIDEDKVFAKLQTLLVQSRQNPQAFKDYLRAQVAKGLYFCFEHEQGLFGLAAQFNENMIPFLIGYAKQKIEHYTQLGKPPERPYTQMLNDITTQPVLMCANLNQNVKAISLCLELGLDPLKRFPGAKTAVHHAVDIGHVKALCVYLDYFMQHRIPLDKIRFGYNRQPLVHYIINHQEEDFVQALIKEGHGKYFEFLMVDFPMDSAKVSVFEQMSMKHSITFWAAMVQKYAISPKSYQYTKCQINFQDKINAHIKRLEVIAESLYIENFLSPDKLQGNAADDLLALLDVPDEKNLILIAIHAHWNGFVTKYFDILNKNGYEAELKYFIGSKLCGKSLLEHAMDANNQDMRRILSIEQGVYIKQEDDHLQIIPTRQQSMQILQSHRFHHLAKTGDALTFIRTLKDMVAHGPSFIGRMISVLDFAQKTPLHYIIDAGRYDMLERLNIFLRSNQLGLQDIFNLNQKFGKMTILEYAKSKDSRIHQSLLEMVKKTTPNSEPNIAELCDTLDKCKL